MTRVLSTLLGAAEPAFSLTLKKIERAAGNPSNDIRLSVELAQRSRTKVAALGLDANDTTAQELYRALEERIGHDDKQVREALGIAEDASSTEIVQAIVQYVTHQYPDHHATFALKPSVARRLLKKQPPKRTMKQLRYRSVDSLLKHELPQHVYIAAFLCESAAWRKKLLDQYTKLRPSDFETRPVDVSVPQTERWNALAKQATRSERHTIFVSKELGAVVVLPPTQVVSGITIATFVLLLNAMNDVVSAGSYIKLQQVCPDFGATVRLVATAEPMTAARIEQEPIPWRVVHQYYARLDHDRKVAALEPHVSMHDLRWQHPEALLAGLHPDLAFWQDTRYTGFLHGDSFVSLNILDVVINYCNRLPYAQRVSRFMQQQLWQECILRYLTLENVEHALAAELAPQLAYIPVLTDESPQAADDNEA